MKLFNLTANKNNRRLVTKSLSLLLLTFVLLVSSISASTEWCWTKSQVNNPGFYLDNSKGGFNWGYCQSKEESAKQSVTYGGYVVTAVTPGAITDSQVFLKLCGSKGCFPRFVNISTNGFDRQGVRQSIKDFDSVDIGEIEKLRIKIVGNSSWQCKEIFILRDGIETKFECLRKIEPCSVNRSLCQLEAIADGSTAYNVSIKTGDEKEDGNTGPFHIILIGDKKISQEKIFSDQPMRYGQFTTSKILTEDIGLIKGVKLILKGKGTWKPTLVKVVGEVSGEEKNFELKNTVLKYPGKNTYEVKDNIESYENDINSVSLYQQIDDIDETTDSSKFVDFDHIGVSSFSESKKNMNETLDINNPNGGVISYIEKKKILNLTCDTKLENTNTMFFGPDFPTKSCEFMTVLARCPSYCYKQSGTVYGIGIHPQQSPICLSAMIDKATSLYGGVVSISITPGLDGYKVPKTFPSKIGNIKIKSYDSIDSMKSYSISKVDNVDLVEKDIRILDAEGNLSNYGRVEIRLLGEWGSICNLGNQDISAQLICKDLGYKSGSWASLEPTFCSLAQGKDYCGAEQSPIHFSNIECTDNDSRFDLCNKKFADREKCNHSKDAIINCFDESFDVDKTIPNKTVRLEAIREKKEIGEVVGRMELYSIDKYLPVCAIKFNNASANIACKTMGYDFGEWVTGKNATPFQLSNDNETGFSASQLDCDESSPNLALCRGIYSGISCNHDLDAVIKCRGENGDHTGKSQYETKPINIPPELGKLGLPDINAKCSTKATDDEFKGDPGSIFKVCCPGNCEKEAGSVWGVGYYSGDSNVCLAAVHSGLVENNSSGCFVLSKTHSNSEFKAYRINQVESNHSDTKFDQAFTLFKLNSGWSFMNNKWKRDDPIVRSFLEYESDSYTNSNKNNSLKSLLSKTKQNHVNKSSLTNSIIQSSFLETAFVLPKPIFSFIEENPKHIFSKNDNFVFKGGRMSKVNDFTIFLKFNMYEFNGACVLFSFRGADGFNIYINQNDELMLGSMTDSKYQKYLGMIVPLKTNVAIFLVQKNGFLNYSIVMQHGLNTSRSKISAIFDIPIEGEVGIGRLSTSNSKQFTGKIEFIEIYPMAISVDTIPELLTSISNRRLGTQNAKRYTIDSRLCVSPCMVSAPLSGNPPPEAILNASLSADISNSSVNGLIKFGESQKTESAINRKIGEFKDGLNVNSPKGTVSPTDYNEPPFPILSKLSTTSLNETNNIEPLIVDEDTTLEDPKFRNLLVPKTFFRVTCPKMDVNTYYPIYGFAIYRANSSICRAAIHFGKLEPNTKQDIVVRVEPIQKAYNGGIGHFNIRSEDVLETDNKLSFTIEEATKLKTIDCDADLRSSLFMNANISDVMIVQCPKDCDKSTVTIFGGNNTDESCPQHKDNSAANCVYSEDSSICKSAIHCGVLNNMGGFIQVKVDGEQPKFIGVESFGINSKEKTSQVRSFSFVGERSAIYANYKENFEGSIFSKYLLINNPSSKYQEKNAWSFYENSMSFIDENGKKENIRAIKHTGIISTDLPYTAASIIKKRDTEFANGLIKFNIMLQELDPIFIYLRYVDTENHVCLMINNKDNMNNFTLFVKIQGSLKIIDVKNQAMELKQWYRFKAYLHSDSIKIEMQEHNVRVHKSLFNHKVSHISRGTVAFGTNGNDFFFITGLSIEPFSLSQLQKDDETTKLTWGYILKKASDINRVKRWCKKTFRHNNEEYSRCALPQFFCRYQCQEILPLDSYSVLNFSCVRECVSTMNNALGLGGIKPNEPEKTYKQGEIVDFLPTGEGKYLPAMVMSVTNKGSLSLASVEYEDFIGNKHKDEVLFADERIDKCGHKLRQRSDCSLNKI